MKIVKNLFILGAAVSVFSAVFSCQNNHPQKTQSDLYRFVNPFIGTAGKGNTYPGATMPFGMVQLSPDIGMGGWDRIAGYYYPDSIISGFSHTHLSGTGAGDLYDILLMPVNSRFKERSTINGNRPFSRFSHHKEMANAGHYQVFLEDYHIKVDLTATRRVGIHQYVFPKDGQSTVHLDLGYAINWDKTLATHIAFRDNHTVVGYRKSTGWAKKQTVYFVIKSSKKFHPQLFEGKKIVTKNHTEGKNSKLILRYDTREKTTVVLKVGISSVSIEQALQNLSAEAPHFDFDTYVKKAHTAWNDQLSKVEITTEDPDEKTLFYTMLYQSMLAPTLYSDVSGSYHSATQGNRKAIGFERYDTFSLWDTYRAAHPLYNLLHPKRSSDMIASLLAHYDETGRLPVWSMWGNETNMMIGYHSVSVIVEAYFKGIDFDIAKAYQACKKTAMSFDENLAFYIKTGYVPAEKQNENWSVSKTLEYAYDDACIFRFAKALGKKADADYFLKRSQNWKNLYDTASKFMRPKDKKGNFIKDFQPKNYTPYFCESNAWQYFWSVQHDIKGLINAVGGKENFEKKLDSFFTIDALPSDKLPIFSTGMIGQYVHGNEPSHHVAYLYNYVGKPWKTAERVRQIYTTKYHNRPDGHCGNEDCGQMASWYVWSSLGLYPVDPSSGFYALGVPLFKQATIHLKDGKKLIIKTSNRSKNNRYVKHVTFNGKPLENHQIAHKELIKGGTLVFEMSKLLSTKEL